MGVEDLFRCVGRRVVAVVVCEEDEGFDFMFEDGSVLKVRVAGPWTARAQFVESDGKLEGSG